MLAPQQHSVSMPSMPESIFESAGGTRDLESECESEASSDINRHDYGVYQTLPLSDSEDGEAAAYLRAVRDEAAALPDVVTVPYQDGDSATLIRQESDRLDAAVNVGSLKWIQDFLGRFSELCSILQRYLPQLTEKGEATKAFESLAEKSGLLSPQPRLLHRSSVEEAQLEGIRNFREYQAWCQALSPDAVHALTVSQILALDEVSVSRILEWEAETIRSKGRLDLSEAVRLYGIAARLEGPLLASNAAAFRSILRVCNRQRAAEASLKPEERAYLSILTLIAGTLYGQDSLL